MPKATFEYDPVNQEFRRRGAEAFVGGEGADAAASAQPGVDPAPIRRRRRRKGAGPTNRTRGAWGRAVVWGVIAILIVAGILWGVWRIRAPSESTVFPSVDVDREASPSPSN